MKVIILHSAQVEASRAIVAELGGEPAGPDVTVTHGGREVRVVSKHALAVAVCPNFSAYPACVVVEESGDIRVKSPVDSWAECLGFALTPPVQEPALPREFTRLEFLNLFTVQEQVLLKGLEATDPVVGLFWEQWRGAEFISTDDPRTIAGVDQLAADGHITPARADAILGRPA